MHSESIVSLEGEGGGGPVRMAGRFQSLNNMNVPLQYLKVVNVLDPVKDPVAVSPERAKYNKELMTKTLKGEQPIIGTFIVKKQPD